MSIPCIFAMSLVKSSFSLLTLSLPRSMNSLNRAVKSSMRARRSSDLKSSDGKVSAIFCECIISGREEDREAEKEAGGSSKAAVMVGDER